MSEPIKAHLTHRVYRWSEAAHLRALGHTLLSTCQEASGDVAFIFNADAGYDLKRYRNLLYAMRNEYQRHAIRPTSRPNRQSSHHPSIPPSQGVASDVPQQ